MHPSGSIAGAFNADTERSDLEQESSVQTEPELLDKELLEAQQTIQTEYEHENR